MGKRKRADTAEAHAGIRAFPSSPSFPPIVGFYCTNSQGKFTYQCFAHLTAAQTFIDMIAPPPRRFLDNSTFHSDNGVTVSTRGGMGGHDLDRVLEHTPTTTWELPEPFATHWRTFPNDQPVDTPAHRPRGRAAAPAAVAVAVTPSNVTSPTPPRAKPARAAGAVTVATLAAEINIPASKARDILRRASEPKPAAGWEWDDTATIERIRAILLEG